METAQLKPCPCPPLREQVALSGDWPVGGTVPVYQGQKLDRRTYARSVAVPTEWEGRVIRLEFDAVAYSAELRVEGATVGSHVGAWLPFGIDITGRVKAGASFDLQVDVAGMLEPPTFVDGWEHWPLGAQQPQGQYGGIVGDVHLRAYGPVYIADTCIRTSVRQARLELVCTIFNASDRSRAVILHSVVTRPDGAPVATLESERQLIQPGQSASVTLSSVWQGDLWWPDDPRLYQVRTAVIENERELDFETRRFGFREIWTESRQFRLNGVRLNIRGDYCGFGGYWPMEYQTRQNLADTYRLLKDKLHFNALRWHMRPAPRYAYEIADEVGMMIVAESAIYGRPSGPMPASVKARYIANGRSWLARWIPSLRNHPSIVLWSPVNEMGPKYPHHQHLTVQELKQFGDETRLHDSTRPIVYHGNAELVEDTQNYHYPLAGNFGSVTQSIYSWKSLIHPQVPTGAGEFLQTSPTAAMKRLPQFVRTAVAEWNKWLLGIWLRGLRYIELADFRPKMFYWMHSELDSPRARLAINACDPVALFDVEYDDLGIVVHVDGKYPAMPASGQVRNFVLYNDEYRDERVEVELELRDAQTRLAKARRQYELALGEHLQFACQVTAGAGLNGKTIELVRRTFKGGRVRFEESSKFVVEGHTDLEAALEILSS